MTLTSPAGRDSETSRHTTWRPKDLVSPSTTTSVPISPPWSAGGDRCCPPSQPITFRIGFGFSGRPVFGSQTPPPSSKHTAPWVSRLKFRGPDMAALKIGSSFSPTPQLWKGGILTIPVSGPPVTTLYGGLLASLPVNMASNWVVSQWDPTFSGVPLTITLPGTIRTDSREDTVAMVWQF